MKIKLILTFASSEDCIFLILCLIPNKNLFIYLFICLFIYLLVNSFIYIFDHLSMIHLSL